MRWAFAPGGADSHRFSFMRIWLRFAVFLLCAFSATAATVHKKAPATKKASVGRKALASRYGSKRKPVAARGKAPARTRSVARVAGPPRQAAPTNERYREIQEALATKGYLSSQPNGVWDQSSQEAMKKFQSDQKLDSNGKLTSRSIIALGLGPPTAAPPAPKP